MKVYIRIPFRGANKVHTMDMSAMEIPRIGESIVSEYIINEGPRVISGIVEDITRTYEDGRLKEVIVFLKNAAVQI